MMRAARERPRIATVTLLGVVVLILCSAAAGAFLAGGASEMPQTAQVRLTSAQQATRDQTRLLDATRAELDASRAALQRLGRRSRELGRANARLRHELRRVRRGARSERQRRGSRDGQAG